MTWLKMSRMMYFGSAGINESPGKVAIGSAAQHVIGWVTWLFKSAPLRLRASLWNGIKLCRPCRALLRTGAQQLISHHRKVLYCWDHFALGKFNFLNSQYEISQFWQFPRLEYLTRKSFSRHNVTGMLQEWEHSQNLDNMNQTLEDEDFVVSFSCFLSVSHSPMPRKIL